MFLFSVLYVPFIDVLWIVSYSASLNSEFLTRNDSGSEALLCVAHLIYCRSSLGMSINCLIICFIILDLHAARFPRLLPNFLLFA